MGGLTLTSEVGQARHECASLSTLSSPSFCRLGCVPCRVFPLGQDGRSILTGSQAALLASFVLFGHQALGTGFWA